MIWGASLRMHNEQSLISAAHDIARELGAIGHAISGISSNNEIKLILQRIELNQGKIMATQAEVAVELRAAKVRIDKVTEEIKKLKVAVSNQANASDELVQASKDVSAAIGLADDENDDETVPTP